MSYAKSYMMPFYRDGEVWVRDWSCETEQQLLQAINRIRKERGPLVPIMVLFKPEHWPHFPTSMHDQGLMNVMAEQQRFLAANPVKIAAS